MDKNKHIGKEIRNLSNKIRRDLDERHLDDLTVTQRWILGYLHRNSGRDVFQRDIEKEFDIRRSTVTGILQILERDGYIERQSVLSDGRLKKLVLTQKAIDHHSRCAMQIDALEEKLCRGFSEEELQQFFDFCQRFSANLEQQ